MAKVQVLPSSTFERFKKNWVLHQPVLLHYHDVVGVVVGGVYCVHGVVGPDLEHDTKSMVVWLEIKDFSA